MGLFYIMPASLEEGDRVELKTNPIQSELKVLILKSYGPPMIFWFYFLAILSAMGFLFLAIYQPMMTMIRGTDALNQVLAVTVFGLFIGLFLALFGFYFYEKRIMKTGTKLTLEHRIFGLKVWSSQFQLKGTSTFETKHFLEGANIARLNNDPSLRAFQNHGHFHLFALLENGRSLIIDRHSRRSDLEKMAELLSQH
jgi:hypothetical protein